MLSPLIKKPFFSDITRRRRRPAMSHEDVFSTRREAQTETLSPFVSTISASYGGVPFSLSLSF